MTLLQKLRLLNQVLGVWKTAEKETTMGKSLLTSKTFWLNVVATLIVVAGYVPPQYGVPALAVLNIANRLLTNQPITSAF